MPANSAKRHELVASPAEADLAVVNTAPSRRRQLPIRARRSARLPRLGSKEVAVTGCWSTLNPQGAAALPRSAGWCPMWRKTT